jgi:hypothetical protein
MKTRHGLFFGFAVFLVAAIFSFSLLGCDNGATDNGNGNNNNNVNPYVGTWSGYIQGKQATVVINSGNTWSISIPADSYSDTGSYSGSGTVATLASNSGTIVGTATSIANVDGTITTITLFLNNNSVAPGSYTLTKQ